MPRSQTITIALMLAALMLAALLGAAIVLQRSVSPSPEASVVLPTKATERSQSEDTAAGRKEREVPDVSIAVEQAERYLQEKGRSARNLFAVYFLTKSESYRDELKRMRDDPVAMTLMANNFNLGSATRARELDPENIYAILLEARAMVTRNPRDPAAIRAFLSILGKTRYERHADQVEIACYEASRYFGKDARQAWTTGYQARDSYGRDEDWTEGAPCAVDLESCVTESWRNEVDPDRKELLLRTMRQLAERSDLEGRSWQFELTDDSFEPTPELEAWVSASFQKMKRDWDYVVALDLATEEDLAAMQCGYAEVNSDYARDVLIQNVGRDAIIQRLIENRPREHSRSMTVDSCIVPPQ